MNIQRICGIALLAAGVALLITGIDASHSITDQVSNSLTGRFTDHTTWFIIGGIVLGVSGLGALLISPRGNKA